MSAPAERKSKETKNDEPKPLFKKTASTVGLPLGPSKQIEVTLQKDLIVVLTQTAFSQLFGYAQSTELEASLLGIVDRDGCDYADKKAELDAAKQPIAAS